MDLQSIIESYGYAVVSVAPFVIGMSSVSAKKFIVLNAVGAFVWAIVVGSGGLTLPQSIANLATLISGGMKGVMAN